MFPTFFDVSLRTGMDRKRAVAGEHFSRAKLLWRLKSGHFLAWNLSWVKPKSNVLDNQITNPLKIDTLTAAILYIHSRHSFYLKGSGLEVLHLLLLPVDEVPVVCEDGSTPLPELQEDCRWNTWIQLASGVLYDHLCQWKNSKNSINHNVFGGTAHKVWYSLQGTTLSATGSQIFYFSLHKFTLSDLLNTNFTFTLPPCCFKDFFWPFGGGGTSCELTYYHLLELNSCLEEY